ncbi:MAG: hypothetical protein AABW54_03885 [Candidatus Micrarchaeota archaeon]
MLATILRNKPAAWKVIVLAAAATIAGASQGMPLLWGAIAVAVLASSYEILRIAAMRIAANRAARGARIPLKYGIERGAARLEKTLAERNAPVAFDSRNASGREKSLAGLGSKTLIVAASGVAILLSPEEKAAFITADESNAAAVTLAQVLKTKLEMG